MLPPMPPPQTPDTTKTRSKVAKRLVYNIEPIGRILHSYDDMWLLIVREFVSHV